MTALQELRMQRLVDRQMQGTASMPFQANTRSRRHRRARKTHTATLAAQSSGLTSSVELGPTEEQATSSSQGSAPAIDQINLDSQVGSHIPSDSPEHSLVRGAALSFFAQNPVQIHCQAIVTLALSDLHRLELSDGGAKFAMSTRY